ncbi:V-type ATP synthase subunit E [Peptoniphilus stercorisuis]|uniref:V-type proton ATPase subunit E n=1 Tax=Peptoniphilus stercorisuis TaxID=1436965 RepID=A0ABS4KFG5_9FIRM|nr:V/A-type H+-transporting ATPase subunit E [Peptoniphilus stercorisuis]
MSNLENITEKIINDAEKESVELVKNAEEKAKTIIEKEELEANKKAEKLLNKASIEAKDVIEKTLSSANLEARDIVLDAKEKVVDRVFSLAIKELENLSTEDYIKYLKEKLKNINIKDDAVLFVPEKYKDAVLSENLNIKVSDETVESGFSILSGKVMYNNEFSSLVNANKGDLEFEVVEKLFN